ncbi:DUF1877 domain-containing protein [Streptomyces sp. Tu 2975]|uniref:DUF1877 domain-containing protein n=1 Tax=Streptomyces sp. Tu 2975 TaxID=2676871 RepID=UPI001358BD18|nr:DUF1877 domain-containing protein [Streptomyces sp. Tu 2975]QIP83476.1 DUF1877 domain-containing protein [Streptomyces sp. Tu 2975]
MALTQQLARVSTQYLTQCRAAAAMSPEGDPEWDPPAEDTVDLDWAIWGLIRFCQRMRTESPWIQVLERSISGGPGGDVEFLDHPRVHDGFDSPPALLAPAAVTEVARELAALDAGEVLNCLPADHSAAAEACGFRGFNGHPREYLVEHFGLLQSFYLIASRRKLAVLSWTD